MTVRIRFLGSGDAFASGGRGQTCILVDGAGPRFLFDCGATALAAMRDQDVDPEYLDLILLTHLHGDHFGGVPLLILDAVVAAGRRRPLTIAGPPETEARVRTLGEAMFPGMWEREIPFRLDFVELAPERPHAFDDLTVTPYPAAHSERAHPTGLRVESAAGTVAYTGDGGWCDSLVALARDADLLIAECSWLVPRGEGHMDYRTLSAHRTELGAKRLVLTHMSAEMLAKVDSIGLECAYDGKVITL